jgi:hypothetical protein
VPSTGQQFVNQTRPLERKAPQHIYEVSVQVVTIEPRALNQVHHNGTVPGCRQAATSSALKAGVYLRCVHLAVYLVLSESLSMMCTMDVVHTIC